jgi:large subunit ribosomal protein L25
MADTIKLKLDKRTLTGRKIKQLRQENILPANIYGKGIKSLAVQLALKDFQTVFNQAGETNIIQLQVAKEAKARPALIHNIHRHPVTDEFLHVDFHQVDLSKTVTVPIPIELTGEAPGVSQGGVLVQLIDEIEVEALPTNLPDKFEVDVSSLKEIGEGISLKELKYDSSKLKLLSENLEELIVKLEEPTKEEEEKPAEAEVPAEGEAAAEAVEEEEKAEEAEKAEKGEPREEKPQKPEKPEKKSAKAEK